MEHYPLERDAHGDGEQLDIFCNDSLVPLSCPDLPEFNEPKLSVAEPSSPLRSQCMTSGSGNMTSEPTRVPAADAAQALISSHRYLDIIDVAYLLGRPPYQIRWFAEHGLLPAHPLKHEGETCWKFRLGELLSWADEIGVELRQEAVSSLLRHGDRSH